MQATDHWIRAELAEAPHTFTYWFTAAFEKLSEIGRTSCGAVLVP